MVEYGCRILLKHHEAQAFFDRARQPDIEALRRRDAFFAQIRQELSGATEGTDLVEAIPDIDIASLLNTRDSYVKDFLSAYTFAVKSRHSAANPTAHANYTIGSKARIQVA